MLAKLLFPSHKSRLTVKNYSRNHAWPDFCVVKNAHWAAKLFRRKEVRNVVKRLRATTDEGTKVTAQSANINLFQITRQRVNAFESILGLTVEIYWCSKSWKILCFKYILWDSCHNRLLRTPVGSDLQSCHLYCAPNFVVSKRFCNWVYFEIIWINHSFSITCR